MPFTIAAPRIDLERYLEVCTEKYEACLDCLDETHSLDGIKSTLRFQHLRFDNNGQPKFAELAEVLADHIVEYCFSARRRRKPRKPHEFSALNREARAYLRKLDTSGEAGEMLLYFLQEAVLKAPQMVAKLELKTNPKMENHGSDGIHMKWHEEDETLDIFFGEAKLEKTLYSALSNMMNSIESFHSESLFKHELGMVTSHYKHADERIRKVVLSLLDRKGAAANFRINHACLVGYNWEEYAKLQKIPQKTLIEEFRKRYISDLPRLKRLINDRFAIFSRKRLRFEVFFLPFETVQGFRDAFNKVV